MAKKQTLKQLLGTSDDRLEVDLDLSTTQLRPTIRGAGNYGIATPQLPRTSATGQLAKALGSISPILRDYQAAKNTEAQTNLVNAETQILDFQQQWEGLSDTERKEFLQQDLSEKNKLENEINKRFLGNYQANPIANIRAQKIIGASLVPDLVLGEEDAFNEFLANRPATAGVPDGDTIREFYEQYDKSFLERANILEANPLVMDGLNARLRDHRVRNQKVLLDQGGKYFKENVLYPHAGKAITDNLLNPVLKEDGTVDFEAQSADLDEIWQVTGGLDFKEASTLLKNWVATVKPEDAERLLINISSLERLPLGNSTVGATPEVMLQLEETLLERERIFERRLEEEAQEEADEVMRDYVTTMRTADTAVLPEGVDNRLHYIENQAADARAASIERFENNQISFDRYTNELEIIEANKANAQQRVAEAAHDVATSANVTQGYFEDITMSSVEDIQAELNAEAIETGYQYSFFDFEDLPTGQLGAVLREDLVDPIHEASVRFEIKRQQLLVNNANLATKQERVTAYVAGVRELETEYKNELKNILLSTSKLAGQTFNNEEALSAQERRLTIQSDVDLSSIPLFTKDARISFSGGTKTSVSDTHMHIFEDMSINSVDVLEGTADNETTAKYMKLKPVYQAVNAPLAAQNRELVATVERRFQGARAGVPLRIRGREHEIYQQTLPAAGLTLEELNELEFVQQYGSFESYYRTTSGFRLTAGRFESDLAGGLIPIIGYDELGEEDRKALAERFGGDYDTFNNRQLILQNLRGQ